MPSIRKAHRTDKRARSWLLIAVIALVWACGANPSSSGHYDLPPPGTPGTARTLEELVTEADLVVVATVTDTRPGRIVGRDDTDPGVAFEETTLAVDEVWAGSATPGDTVLVESERDASPFSREWRKKGTRVLAFLWLKRDAESAGRFYRPLVPQGIFLVDADRLVPAAKGDLADAAAALGIDGLQAATADARAQDGGG